MASIPFRISRGDRSGENILTAGPVVDLFNRPHPYLSRFRFWEFIVTWYCLRGEAFLVVEALSRSVTHTAMHVGQIVLLAKHFAGSSWRSLSIPKGQSAAASIGDFKTKGLAR